MEPIPHRADEPQSVSIPLGPGGGQGAGNIPRLEGQLALPSNAKGVVVFVHGSGSSRFSPRNRFVAQALRTQGAVGTLLVDLLSADEEAEDERTARFRFDVVRLASRVCGILSWVREHPRTAHLPVGLFGASTGAGAALLAAAERPDAVAAIVSRGGRPDLAGPRALSVVKAPTLLIVGGEDRDVIALNVEAKRHLVQCTSVLEIVPKATHLFEEPGALASVAQLASAWFRRHLGTARLSEPWEAPRL